MLNGFSMTHGGRMSLQSEYDVVMDPDVVMIQTEVVIHPGRDWYAPR